MPRLQKLLKGIWTTLTTVVYTVLVCSVIIVIAPFSRDGRVTFYLGKFWSWLVLKSNGVRLNVMGGAKVTKDRSYIFISNHTSNLDPPIMALSVDNVVRFVAKKSLTKVPFFGQASKMARMIYIDRDNSQAAIETLNESLRELKNGISACFFAEGQRNTSGRLGQFKKGGVMMALRAGLPIVPVTIVDSCRLLGKKSVAITPGEVDVIIGDPIDTRGCTEEHKDLLLEKVRTVIAANLEKFGNFEENERPLITAA